MKCPYCSRVNPDNESRCAYCGKKLSNDDDGKKVSVIAIVIIAAALAVITVALFIHSSRNTRNSFSHNSGSDSAIDVGTPYAYNPLSTPFGYFPSIDPYSIIEPTGTPGAASAVAAESSPSPSQEEYTFSVTEIYADKAVIANGFTVSYADMTESSSVISVDDNKIKTGSIEKAFLVTLKSGNLCILTTEQGFESIYAASYGFDGQRLFKAYEYEFCSLDSIKDGNVRMTVTIDCFGTWRAQRLYSVTEKYAIEPLTDYLGVTDETYKSKALTTLCDIYALDENGEQYVLEAGSVLHIAAVELNKNEHILAHFKTEDGREAGVYYIPTDGGFCAETPDGLKNEYEVFDDLPYSG